MHTKSFKLFLSVVFSFLLLFPFSTHAYADDNLTIDKDFIDSYTNLQLGTNGIPGSAVSIVKNNEVVYSKGYGTSGNDLNDKVTPDTIFMIGSLSKSITAVGTLQLQDQKKLNIDDLVTKYLPWFKSKNVDLSNKITIRELLNHTSGIPAGAVENEINFYTNNEANLSTEDLVKRLADVEITEPDKKYVYSNTNYLTLGLIIEKVSDSLYSEFIKQNILIPLEMSSTYLNQKDIPTSLLAKPFVPRIGIPVKTKEVNLSSILPAGGIASTLHDLNNYLMFQMDEGVFKGNTVLSKESIELIRTHPSYSAYGMGFISGRFANGDEYFYHNGAVEGYFSEMTFIPKKHIGVITLNNMCSTILTLSSSQNYFALGILSNVIGNQKDIEVKLTGSLLLWGVRVIYVYYFALILIQIVLLKKAKNFYERYDKRARKKLFMGLSLLGLFLNSYFLILPGINPYNLFLIAPDLTIIWLIMDVLIFANIFWRVYLLINLKKRTVVEVIDKSLK